ncbi:SEC-C domain-containing protein [uncultured Paludibaculum sp.]|uniref:SEC-C domain-containing protein n=1 Tax=uncultured Paludibaculum sp. TaxID=1765020 RepID=UPI002AAB0767|nr:SEC-C domain-containing protein [uncultured Paludibaculum sp.]
MATAAQITANRANAQHSTGPHSEQGKARSAQNNLRYGFRSQSVLLPGDDPAEYEELLDELTTHFDVQDLSDQRFVREMADAEWRLRRVRAHQEVLLTAKIEELATTRPNLTPVHLQALAFDSLHRDTTFARFLTYEAKFERQYERAYQSWMQTKDKLSRHRAREISSQFEASLILPKRTDEPNSGYKPAIIARPGPDIEANQKTPSAQPARTNEPEPRAIPRSAPCPCGSGEKYKRCCGRNAPAVLTGPATAKLNLTHDTATGTAVPPDAAVPSRQD